MKKIIFLLLCCGVIIGMIGCGGNTAPATYRESTYNGGRADREGKRAYPDRKQGSDNRADCDRHRASNNGKANERNQIYGDTKTDRTIGGGNQKITDVSP